MLECLEMMMTIIIELKRSAENELTHTQVSEENISSFQKRYQQVAKVHRKSKIQLLQEFTVSATV